MTGTPRWARLFLRALAPADHLDDVLGDLEEAYRYRLQRRGRCAARLLTTIETFEMGLALVRARVDRFRIHTGNTMVQDYRLGLRMLVKYPGLTLAGGLALAIAIGLGAGWYDFMRDFFRPRLPLPEGHRVVEVEMRNLRGAGDEQRLLHDFAVWRQHARLLEDLGAYRTLERNLILGDARPQPVTVAQMSASGFRVARVAPILGRPLLDSDEEPGAAPVVVLGHDVWQQRFGGRGTVVGETVQLGHVTTTVVGVMPQGFAFPVNHRMWVPLQIRASGHGPLEGPGIRVFGRIAPGATQEQAFAEVTALTRQVAAASPRTHEYLQPRVLAWGGESPGDRPVLELALTHLPILLVLVVACVNVGTLVYARTATREAEIAMRFALGAGRGRIMGQLFVEALVLASLAAVLGLGVANWALKWGVDAYYAGANAAPPFWLNPGLKASTVIYAAGLTALGAGLLSLLPALKITGVRVQTHLRNLGSGGSTLRFGGVWTTAMILQVALTVICLPPAMGIAHEAFRDRRIRDRFPAEEYLAIRLGFDREEDAIAARAGQDSETARRVRRVYEDFERRVRAEPGVVAVTVADRLPGMSPAVRPAEVEASPGAAPLFVPNLWVTSVGPGFFEAFDVAVVAGRGFHEGDRTGGGERTIVVNEAFARRYFDGTSPVGRRVRYAGSPNAPEEPWLEIVGMVRDIGMTPTDLGEAPYVYHAVAAGTASPLVMGVRTTGDPTALAGRLRAVAVEVDPALRLDEVRSLDDLVWRVDLPQMVAAGAIAAVVCLGLFLSAAGIFSLMSVSVARRTREIGLRAALGASRARLLGGIFSRAGVLVGTGVAAGNAVLLLVVTLSDEVELSDVWDALLVSSSVMLVAGLLACLEPARRALGIDPTQALKES